MGPAPEMGIEGAALATGLGQCLTLVIYLVINRLRPLPLHISLRNLKNPGKMAARLYAIGDSSHAEPGAAFAADFLPERDSGGLLADLCAGAGRVL